MIVLAALLCALAIAALTLWLIGDQPVYRLRHANWFVATRGDGALAPSSDGQLIWSANSDFVLIGADEAYWSRFALVTGASAPSADRFDDAYIARLRMFAPPRIALGLIRVLVAAGVLSRPSIDDVAANTQQLGFRAELMPNATAIAALVARPDGYAPAMVNFLRYVEQGGREAYRRYGLVAMRTVFRTGGHLLLYGAIAEVVREAKAGPTVGAWHDIAAMRYPNPRAILSMEHVPEYRAALKHRDAGLERTVVIASTPIAPRP